MRRMTRVVLALLLISSAQAKVVTKEYTYKVDTTTLRGFVAYDDAAQGKRPGVLVAHDWWGLTDFSRTQARRLAELGYVAFAVDMYGNGQNTTDMAVARKLAGGIRGTPLMRSRIRAGLDAMLRQDNVDPKRVAAIGFCFGGTSILDLAYSGADVKGVVTFHGGLFSVKQEDLGHVKAKFLILHGADDPTMTRDTINQFQESLRRAGADWQMVYFGNAVHGFCNPASGNDKSKGSAYDPVAAARSWKDMEDFLQDVLANK